MIPINEKEGDIFNSQHLAVVRAALQFWTDEMRPDGIDVWRHYFEDPGNVPDANVARETQQLFATCRLLSVERCDDGRLCVAESWSGTSNDTATYVVLQFPE